MPLHHLAEIQSLQALVLRKKAPISVVCATGPLGPVPGAASKLSKALQTALGHDGRGILLVDGGNTFWLLGSSVTKGRAASMGIGLGATHGLLLRCRLWFHAQPGSNRQSA